MRSVQRNVCGFPFGFPVRTCLEQRASSEAAVRGEQRGHLRARGAGSVDAAARSSRGFGTPNRKYCLRICHVVPLVVKFFSPLVGFKRNLSLLDIFYFFPGVLSKWKLRVLFPKFPFSNFRHFLGLDHFRGKYDVWPIHWKK